MNDKPRIPTMLPEPQVQQFVSKYYRATHNSRFGKAAALRALINEVYAQGVTAGQQPSRPPVELQPGAINFDGAEAYEAYLDHLHSQRSPAR